METQPGEDQIGNRQKKRGGKDLQCKKEETNHKGGREGRGKEKIRRGRFLPGKKSNKGPGTCDLGVVLKEK